MLGAGMCWWLSQMWSLLCLVGETVTKHGNECIIINCDKCYEEKSRLLREDLAYKRLSELFAWLVLNRKRCAWRDGLVSSLSFQKRKWGLEILHDSPKVTQLLAINSSIIQLNSVNGIQWGDSKVGLPLCYNIHLYFPINNLINSHQVSVCDNFICMF